MAIMGLSWPAMSMQWAGIALTGTGMATPWLDQGNATALALLYMNIMGNNHEITMDGVYI